MTVGPHLTENRCRIIRGGGGQQSKQGLAYAAGVSTESAGARGLCLHTVYIPPGGRALAHRHEAHESAIYVISGSAEMWSGEGLADVEMVNAGDFVYIPAGVPHLPVNRSATEPMLAVLAWTDPNEQEERGAAAGARRGGAGRLDRPSARQPGRPPACSATVGSRSTMIVARGT